MPQYRLTEKGIKEARKRRTTAKAIGEAVTFGGPWKGEEYSNVLLFTLLNKPRQALDAHTITVETFNRPRPSETKISQTLSNLASKGLIKAEPRFNHSGFSDKGGSRLSRRHRRGFKRVKFT